MKHPRRIDPPYRISAEHLPWRSASGLDLTTCVGHWLQSRIAARSVPDSSAAADECIRFGNFCGLAIEEDTNGRRGKTGRPTAFLVTEPAITACIAALGIECSTPAHLQRALAELVVAGHLERSTEVRAVATLGPVAFYRLHASILRLDADTTESPESPTRPKPALRVISALRSSPMETSR